MCRRGEDSDLADKLCALQNRPSVTCLQQPARRRNSPLLVHSHVIRAHVRHLRRVSALRGLVRCGGGHLPMCARLSIYILCAIILPSPPTNMQHGAAKIEQRGLLIVHSNARFSGVYSFANGDSVAGPGYSNPCQTHC